MIDSYGARGADNKLRPSRILIFLLGSLGDTVVALPALRLVARKFPGAERRILTDSNSNQKVTSMAALLQGTNIAHGYFQFPFRTGQSRRLKDFIFLAREIRAWKPELLVYLHEPRGRGIALRDAALFRLLGIRRTIGVPLSRSQQQLLHDERTGTFERRSEYLARSLAPLGDAMLSDPTSWSLSLSDSETAHGHAVLEPLSECRGILAISIGTKIDVNDWGDANWSALLADLGGKFRGWGLIALGAPVERDRSAKLLSCWAGKSVNLCGSVTARESAAVLKAAQVFIGHDSGPMHLAAAVGTKCAAIFSARNLPGIWFPHGEDNRVFYKKTECAGCGLRTCVEFNKKCIAMVSVDEVSAAVQSMVSTNNVHWLRQNVVNLSRVR
jgi:heptosyltransferase-3